MSEGHRLTRDIDPSVTFDSDELDQQLARVVEGIASAFRRSEDLDDSFQTLINLLLRAFVGTHRSMRILFEKRDENPGTVADAMSLAREQIEKVFVVILLLDDPPRWTIAYLRDDWRRRYERFLLEGEERSGLERFKDTYENGFSRETENERLGLAITEVEKAYVEWEFHKRPGESTPREYREAKVSMTRFPTPGQIVPHITNPRAKALLDRWHKEYGQYSGYSHVSLSKLKANMLRSRKLTLTDQQRETILHGEYLPSMVVSYLTAASACVEALYMSLPREDGPPRAMALDLADTDILAELESWWDTLHRGSLLGQVLWEIRLEHLDTAP